MRNAETAGLRQQSRHRGRVAGLYATALAFGAGVSATHFMAEPAYRSVPAIRQFRIPERARSRQT
ncbi:MAG: hypothetical protein M3Y41_13190 [Pseudomonadota bacterium]|nr:hypothetical protein [Pseudomonadota bacterium]